MRDPKQKKLADFRRKGKCSCWMCRKGKGIKNLRREISAEEELDEYNDSAA